MSNLPETNANVAVDRCRQRRTHRSRRYSRLIGADEGGTLQARTTAGSAIVGSISSARIAFGA